MTKVAFTVDNFKHHVMYVISVKNKREIAKDRFNLLFKGNKHMSDLGGYLKNFGEDMAYDEIEQVVQKYCEDNHQYIVETYVKHSKKSSCLDYKNECHTTTGEDGLHYLKGNCTYQMHERQRINDNLKNGVLENEDNKCKIDKELVEILKGLDTEEEKMSAINTYMSADIIAMYMNETKKQRGIGGRKTKAIDIEKMSNEHIVGEENPHDHFMFAPYDPASVTGRFINPMAFSYTKQKVHIAFEKKYSWCLDQGIAIGYWKKEGLFARREFLAECIANGQNWKEARKSYNAIKSNIYNELSSNKSTAEVIASLKEKGIHLTPNSFGKMKIELDDSKVELNTASFTGKDFEVAVKKFTERFESDRTLKSGQKVDKIEDVLTTIIEKTKVDLERDLKQAITPEQQKIAKLNAFKEFEIRCHNAGLIVNLNKQGNMSYHTVQDNNFKKSGIIENNAKLTKYKASTFINPELQGKSLILLFGLDEEAIMKHQNELFAVMPKTLNYRQTVYTNVDLTLMNTVDQEWYLQKRFNDLFDYYNTEAKPNDDGSISFFNKDTGEAIAKVMQTSDTSWTATCNIANPKAAGAFFAALELERARTLGEGQVLTITPPEGCNNFDHLRHLQVDLMFSTDSNSNKVRVEYPNKATDEQLEKLIEQRLDKELQRFDKNVQKFSKNKTKFTFTEASGVHLIRNPDFIDYQDKIQDQFNRQIVDMITKNGITEIKFSTKDDQYIERNEKALLKLAESLTDDKRKLVEEVIESHKTQASTSIQSNNKKKIRPTKLKI